MSALTDSLISISIILLIVIVFYLKMTKKTFNEAVKDLIDFFKETKDEIEK